MRDPHPCDSLWGRWHDVAALRRRFGIAEGEPPRIHMHPWTNCCTQTCNSQCIWRRLAFRYGTPHRKASRVAHAMRSHSSNACISCWGRKQALKHRHASLHARCEFRKHVRVLASLVDPGAALPQGHSSTGVVCQHYTMSTVMVQHLSLIHI